MSTWNCCRTCLGVQSLNPIFFIPEHNEKYTEIILNATGIKVELNDTLPQEICATCINFINNSYKFRKKCEENQKILLSRITDNQMYEIKIESIVFKSENNDVIDISDLVNDFKPYNDSNINDFVDSVENNDNDDIHFETKVQDIVDKPIEIIFKDKKSKRNVVKPVRRTLRTKKESGEKKERVKEESGEKKERVKEEIECEYCHKILTSKLSLRNHYKIHTGFDVVCEHCGKKFITRRLLLMHCRAKHGYEKTDKCSFCDYRASNAEQVKIHERLHTGEKPYVCASCGAGFHRKSSYLQHVAIHLPDKTVQEDIDAIYRWSEENKLEFNITKCHDPWTNAASNLLTAARAKSPLPRTLRTLNRFLDSNPESDMSASDRGKFLSECMKFCERDCDQCPARFKSVTLMRIHKNRHRAPQYSFKCRVCDNSFARRRNVARHLQRIHGLQPTHENIDRHKIV